jgi:fructose-bisphosphate aldolase class II
VPVEAELGKLAGVEDNISVAIRTQYIPIRPGGGVRQEDRMRFSGRSHRHKPRRLQFKGEPKLDFERLEKIKNLLPGFPLVLHGASSAPADLVKVCNDYGAKIPGARGVPEEMISKATKMGVCKVNIDTDLRLAMTGAIRKVFVESPAEFDPRKYLGPARDAIKQVVKRKIGFLGCAGKA